MRKLADVFLVKVGKVNSPVKWDWSSKVGYKFTWAGI